MYNVRVLNQAVLEKVLDMQQVIAAVEQVYVLKSQGKAATFPLIFHEFESGVADMDIKSGYLEDIFGLKLVSWFGGNTAKGLRPLIGTSMVFDSKTGQPLGILNAEHITGMRTGAAGAIGAKYLAKKNAETLLMVGTGHQATFQIAAILLAMDTIKKVRIHSPKTPANAEKLCKSIKHTLFEEFLARYSRQPKVYESIRQKFDIEFEVAADLKTAVGLSEVIITATPSRKPLIMREWVKKGTHFSCVGADMEGKQEIDEGIFKVAKVYVDDVKQAIEVGETEIPIKKKAIVPEDIRGEIGDVISGKIAGRLSDDEITVFDTTGIALQDLMVAKIALDIAQRYNLGVSIDL